MKYSGSEPEHLGLTDLVTVDPVMTCKCLLIMATKHIGCLIKQDLVELNKISDYYNEIFWW